MTEQPTEQRTQGEIPEIRAFRYMAASEKASLNPLNLNGLSFGGARRTLSDRLLSGIQVLVDLAPKASAPAEPEMPTDELGVLRYHLPLTAYRERRRRNLELGRRVAVAGLLAVTLPLLAVFGLRQLTAWKAPSHAQAPVPQATLVPMVTYQVKKGDTLSAIARAHKVRVRALLLANGFEATHKLKIGESLKIPPRTTLVTTPAAKAPDRAAPILTTAAQLAAHEATGVMPAVAPGQLTAKPSPETPKLAKVVPVAPARKKDGAKARRRTKKVIYVVQSGDTLGGIAEKFDLRSVDLIAVNDLDRNTRLKIGREIVVPPAPVNAEKRGYRKKDKQDRKIASRGIVGDLGRVVVKRFLFPTMGSISSRFGHRSGRLHTGLDIRNHVGAPIQASKPGVVLAAGWEGDYGKTVDISHGNGVVTRYAHCSKLLVKPGQRVKQGQTIGLVGETGRATGPHLHYEVRIHGRPVDPKKYI